MNEKKENDETKSFLFYRLNEEHYPKLAAYHNTLKDRPSIKKTWPPNWNETPGQPALKDF